MEQKHMEISCDTVTPALSSKYPWFVAQNLKNEGDDDTQAHIFYNLHDPLCHYHCKVQELLGKRIRGCFHGCWVLLSSNHPLDVMWSLWNPITSKIINLPPLNHIKLQGDYDAIRSCCLTAPPDHPNSFVLLTRTQIPNFVYCRLRRPKRQKLRWIESTYAKQVKTLIHRDGLLLCLTCCNGKVYAYTRSFDKCDPTSLLVEVNIVVNARKSKKLREGVITLLPVLEFTCPRMVNCLRVPLLKGSCTELFIIFLGLKDERKTVAEVNVFKVDMNNMACEEMEDLKDTILSVELTDLTAFYSPAITSSEVGGYIHILADKGEIIYSYHVKDKTISLSSIPCLAGTNHVSAWAMVECTRLGGDRAQVDNKQEKESDNKDEIDVRSVKGNLSSLFRVLGIEVCVGVECLKLLPLSNFGYERDYMWKKGLVETKNRLERDNPVNKQEPEVKSHLLNLPSHVLEMLMKFSVGVEYLKFRSTCKRCHTAAPLIQWNNGKTSKGLLTYSLLLPWLIVFDKHKGIITFTDPVFDDKYFIRTPQELICDLEVKCSRYGWLLILKPSDSLVFFNPFTSDIHELPQLPYLDIISFSAPPTSPDCLVVGITIHMWYYHICIHIVGGEPSWRRILLDISDGMSFYSSITFYGRDLYALRDDGGLDVCKEIGKEDHSLVRNVAQAQTSICTFFPQCFQVKCDQHLLRVTVGKFGESVQVFRLNDSSQKWVKIDALGKHMIFICDTSSFCLDAKTPEMENKICFPRFPILFYSLETCRFHTFNNKKINESFGDFFGTKHYLTPHAWIEPSWS